MKKLIKSLSLSSLSLLLIACQGQAQTDQRATNESQAESSQSLLEESQAKEETKAKQADETNSSEEKATSDTSEENSVTESTNSDTENQSFDQASETNPDYPYGVPVETIGTQTFYSHGVNAPTKIVLQADEKRVIMEIEGYPDTRVEYVAELSYIPTQTVTTFNNYDTGKRQVQANTQVKLVDIVSDNTAELPQTLYLIYNEEGGLSLITPNYAGNVEAEDADTMMEYR